MLLNLPNRITLLRLVLAIALFIVLAMVQVLRLSPDGALGLVAFALFVIATATDWVDGYLARKLGQVTVFGRIMDPFVDKVVTGGTYVLLCALYPEQLPPWMVVIILAREFFVNAIRGYMESQGISFAAELPGKIKMFLQCLALGGLLLQMAIGAPPEADPRWLHLLTQVLIWCALISTIHSGWLYARRAFAHLREKGA